MSIIWRHARFGSVFQFNVINTQTITGAFSTTTAGNPILVEWGDGTSNTYAGIADQAYSKDYGSAGNRTVTIRQSQRMTWFTMMQSGANIAFNLRDLPVNLTYFRCLGSNTVSGDIANLPVNMTSFRCDGINTVSGDIANLPVNLTYFRCQGINTVSGDIANLPVNLIFFRCQGSNTINAYTSPRTWRTNQQYMLLTGIDGLSVSHLSNLIIDMSAVAWIADRVFNMTTPNASMSDTTQGGIWGDFSSGNSPSTLATALKTLSKTRTVTVTLRDITLPGSSGDGSGFPANFGNWWRA